jgi:hypothetical protein
VPAKRYLHPEYGLGCPSLRLRERLRISVISATLGAVVGAIAGASGVAVLLSDQNMHAVRTPMLAAELPAARAPGGGAPPETDGVGPGSSQPAAPPAAAETARAEGPCEIESWVRHEGRCVQPMRMRRVLVGGPDAHPAPGAAMAATESSAPSSPVGSEETTAGSQPARQTEADAPAPAAEPVVRKKKKRAVTRRPARDDAWMRQTARDGLWNAHGYAGYYEGRGRPSRGFERSWQWGR